MLEQLSDHLSTFNGYLWGYVLLFALLGSHLYLTIILRFPQRYIFKAIGCYFKRDKNKESGHISPFSSLMISLAANIGTGNIIGVAVALCAGGPGAIFWCWVTGVLGISTRYAESLLASRYRVKDEKGEIVGGPMYALERGLKCKWLAIFFAVLTAIAALGIGNITQSNAVAGVLQESALQMPLWLTGGILSILVGAALLGGLKRISGICRTCVPTMALIYMIGCALLLITQAEYILPALSLIVKSAFSSQAAAGGFIGSTIMIAMQTGVQRGLFSNEAGMGSAPIVSAPARTPKSSIVWDFADIANGLMALPNLICMVGLSSIIVAQTRYYLWGNKLDEEDNHIIPNQDEVDQKAPCEK